MTRKGAVSAKTAVLKQRTFRREFKLQVIREVGAGKSQAQVAREYQVSDNTISKWRRELRKYKERAFAGRGHGYTDEAMLLAIYGALLQAHKIQISTSRTGNPYDKCQSRTVHAHAQIRRGLLERLRNAGRGPGLGPAFHRSSL